MIAPTGKLLFLKGLPQGTTESMLTNLFANQPGFKEVRMVPGKAELAFVEFELESGAMHAKKQLNGFQITPSHQLQIDFAKR